MQAIDLIQERHALAMTEMQKSIEHIIRNDEPTHRIDSVTENSKIINLILCDLQTD